MNNTSGFFKFYDDIINCGCWNICSPFYFTCIPYTNVPSYLDIPHDKDLAMKICNGLRPKIPHDKDLAMKICNGLRPKISFYTSKLITRTIMRCRVARSTSSYLNLPKPNNEKIFEKELEELTKSTSASNAGSGKGETLLA
ncbi:hypothetical protein Glove_230g34 [Diversispora epigaea]|uniref:Uncharacterized protein n=1 Tax=Diversispora epigaea TaxID=1348612 RepID=A0A397ILR8_9GLOM|nr:hypothetical protein Glove_230g34 [Diversispora epigaea]